ncbi:MAG: hypothetical protein RL722_2196 [Pseudomonadota bacterium]|jgi:CHAT domain-containing protein
MPLPKHAWHSLALAAALACAATPALAISPIYEAEALNDQVIQLAGQGRAANAIPLAEKALALRQKALGLNHPITATSLNNLASLYRETGDYGKAELLFLRALAIRDKALGADHPDTAISQSNLADLYQATGAYTKAEPLFLRALATNEKSLGADHPHTATALNNLATLYENTGDYVKAEPLYLRALAITEKALGADQPATATSLNNLASLYQKTGDYAKPEPLYLRALAIKEKALGADHLATATSLNNLAGLYSDTGDYAKAEPLYLRALAINEKALGANHPDTATSLNNLADLYSDTGAYAKAEPLYLRALAITEKALGADHPDTATWLNNLAGLYRDTGDYTKARSLYLRALAIREKALGVDHPTTATSLNNLAGLYEVTGDYTKAEPLYLRALAVTEKAQGADHRHTAARLNNLASLYISTGAYDKAEPLFLRALAVYEKALGADHPDTETTLNNLAILHWAQDKLPLALPQLARALSITEVNITRLVQSGTEERRRQYLATLGHSSDVSYSLADPAPAARALGAAAVLQLKGRVLDATADAQGRLRQQLDAPGQAVYTQWQKVVARRSELSLAGSDAKDPAAWNQQLANLAEEEARLETDLANRSRSFQQAVQPVTLQRVQAALGARDVLIEWTRYEPFNPKGKKGKDKWGSPRYAAYLITRDRPPEVVDLGPADTIEAATQSLQQQLLRPVGDPRPAAARELHRLVMQPLLAPLAKLQPQPGQVLLSPDGALNLVPLAALVDDEKRYLGERFALSYLSSGRDLLKLQDNSAAPRSGITVMANPDYNQTGQGQAAPTQVSTTAAAAPANQRAAALDRSGMSFSPLPGTAGEATLLRQLFKLPAEQVATGAAATEARLKQVHGPGILHIATHGFFLDELPQAGAAAGQRGVAMGKTRVVETDDAAPVAKRREGLGENPLLRSGLALAGANQRRSEGGEDGILTAAEAAQLDLQGTQLVVLSACQTGTGDVANGEGVYGLRRALVLAGAQSQLVSLWSVNDAATEQLMGEYYRRLQQGEGRAQALRSAQDVIRANPATAHPYFWAPFIPVGDWRPLQLGPARTAARTDGTR